MVFHHSNRSPKALGRFHGALIKLNVHILKKPSEYIYIYIILLLTEKTTITQRIHFPGWLCVKGLSWIAQHFTPDLSEEKSMENPKAHLASRSLSSRGGKLLYDSKSQVPCIKPTLYPRAKAYSSFQGKIRSSGTLTGRVGEHPVSRGD